MQAVIFDMDGVILESEPLHDDAWCKVVVDRGFGTDAEMRPHLNDFRGRTEVDFFTFVRDHYNLDTPIQEMIDQKIYVFLEMMKETSIEPMPGLTEVLDNLKGRPIALASSSAYPIINAIVDGLGIRDRFDVIVSGEDVENGKPAPDIFLLAAKKLGVDPSECIVIEDSRNGVKAANAAGMRSIGFRGSPSHNQDLSEADTVIDHFDDLLGVL